MGNILRVKDANGNWIEIPALIGPKGEPGDVSIAQLEAHRGNKNVHVSAEEKHVWNEKQNALPDYIVEQGVNQNWTYRKWASGFAELWGNGIQAEWTAVPIPVEDTHMVFCTSGTSSDGSATIYRGYLMNGTLNIYTYHTTDGYGFTGETNVYIVSKWVQEA